MPGVDHPHRAAPAARRGAACGAEAFRGVDRLVARLYARDDALLEHERDPFVPTPERVAGLLSEVRAAAPAAGRLTAPGGTLARIAAENIREVPDAFDARVRTERDFPHQYTSHVARRVTALPPGPGQTVKGGPGPPFLC